MNLLIHEIENIQDSQKLPINLKEQLQIFLDAINDWPTQIIDLSDYERELSILINNDLNQTNLKQFLKEVDYSKNAWEAESISQLLKLFDNTTDKVLLEIIKDLQISIKFYLK